MLVFAVVIATILLLAVIGLLLRLLNGDLQSRREAAGQSSAIAMLQQQLELLRNNQQTALQSGQQSITQTLQQHHQTLSQLHRQIGELQTQSNQVAILNTDIRRLNDILSSPKLRGQLGEWSLENLLASVLPKEAFSLQHRFNDGKIVDALVRLPQFNVPIDAKFPLPSFEAMVKCGLDDELSRLQRQFQKDVSSHIDKIASQYIRPAEGTLDFAMMYIPAENVYYETIIKNNSGESIADYALSKKVVPVSPNVLYAYLMTVAMGLHGLQIEKQAAKIRENLRRLENSFDSFGADFKTLGTHIRNTAGKYDDAEKKLSKFDSELGHITEEQENI